MELLFERISGSLERKAFDCGVDSLNDYLKRYALQNLKKNVGVTIVAVAAQQPKKILGYYSASMAQVEFSRLPEDLSKDLPRYPVPAMRIGRLAVDRSAQGQGLGAALLRDALLRALQLSHEVGTCMVLVDALDEKAKAFYARYGFLPLTDLPLTLILPVKTIATAFGE